METIHDPAMLEASDLTAKQLEEAIKIVEAELALRACPNVCGYMDCRTARSKRRSGISARPQSTSGGP